MGKTVALCVTLLFGVLIRLNALRCVVVPRFASMRYVVSWCLDSPRCVTLRLGALIRLDASRLRLGILIRLDALRCVLVS